MDPLTPAETGPLDQSEHERVRRAKRDQILLRGIDPYGAPFPDRETIAHLRERTGTLSPETLPDPAPSARIAGRIVLMRKFGKAFFATLQDEGERFQIYVKADLLKDYATWAELLDLGDIVGVEGAFFFTKTGEPTLQITSLTLLAKSVRPLPDKWHGLSDTEARYRQRYVDLIVTPDTHRVFITRSLIVRFIRNFMDGEGFLEVETPMMQPTPGGALARPFATHHNALDIELFLRIAPELYLKRLIVGGMTRVYEINRNFRNEGVSTRHNPEFTMMEFYAAYASYEDLMTLTERLFSDLAQKIHGKTRIPFGDHEIDLSPPFRRISYLDSIGQAFGLAPEDYFNDGRLIALLRSKGIPVPEPRPGKPHVALLLNALFEEAIEPTLTQPTFVTGYPKAISPLARSSENDPEVTDRFELFIAGIEVANGFNELNDPDEQLRRFLSQQESRQSGDLEAPPPDYDYVRALEYGLPPTAGEGIGIDRLVMLLTNQTSIRDVLLFPLLRPDA
ncbi:MAG: lysine--tRNA ligase [Leptospirales bacterium]